MRKLYKIENNSVIFYIRKIKEKNLYDKCILRIFMHYLQNNLLRRDTFYKISV